MMIFIGYSPPKYIKHAVLVEHVDDPAWPAYANMQGGPMVAKRNGLHGKALEKWVRRWRRVIWRGVRILRPLDVLVVMATHVPITILDDLSTLALERRLGGSPRRIDPRRGPARAAVVLAPGLQQTAYSTWWLGLFLSVALPVRILFLQTPKNGNTRPFEEMVQHNRWITLATDGLPLYGVGFSKGGLDLVWLWHDLMEHGRQVEALFTISTPFRGTALAKLIKTVGAKTLTPGSLELRKTLILLHKLRTRGIALRFFCALLDRICRRSDARPPREEPFAVPSPARQLIDWLLWLLTGTRREAARPWWWATTLPQIGHTALYNPLVWIVMSLLIRRSIAESSQAPATPDNGTSRNAIPFRR